MIIVDLTRLHYCLQYEYQQYKDIVLKKWRSFDSLKAFVEYVVPQWFDGPFSNWQVFCSPPGFASTNNPMESFNKIIKSQFTNFENKAILSFIHIVTNHLIPYYSNNEKEFMFYRIPHLKTKQLANQLNNEKFQMRSIIECIYIGRTHTQSINFQYKSCTCRWFLAFAVCAHLVAACDLFKQPLDGYSKPKVFVYRTRPGRKKAALTFSEKAFQINPMPTLSMPDPVESNRIDLFSKNDINVPGNPLLNEVDVVPCLEENLEFRILRSKKVIIPKNSVKRLDANTKTVKKRGRPCKNPPALSNID